MWIAMILWFHQALSDCVGNACICDGNAVGRSSDAKIVQLGYMTKIESQERS